MRSQKKSKLTPTLPISLVIVAKLKFGENKLIMTNNGNLIKIYIWKTWPAWLITLILATATLIFSNGSAVIFPVLGMILVSVVWTIQATYLLINAGHQSTSDEANTIDNASLLNKQTVDCFKNISETSKNEIPPLIQSMEQLLGVMNTLPPDGRHPEIPPLG